MRTEAGDKINEVVRRHIGAANAINAVQICAELDWPETREREVRRIIADESMMWEGMPVCGIPGKGYFVGETIDELETYDNYLTDLLARSTNKRNAFRQALRKMGIRFPLGEQRKAA